MCFWTLSGRNLESQIGELTLPRTFTNVGGGVFSHNIENQGRFGLALVSDEIDPSMDKHMKNEEELENIYVSFLAMGFLKQTIVASGDDGFVSFSEFILYISCIFGRMSELSEDFLHTKDPSLQ
jgi:hypothetical protein